MDILRGYQYRIEPTPEQQIKLAKQFGCVRFVYNHFLDERQKKYLEHKIKLSYEDMANALPALKDEFPWLKEVHSQVLQQALVDLEQSYQNFFAKRAKYPKFKRKFAKQTCRYPQGFQFRVYKNHSQIYLPKIGWVKLIQHRPYIGTVKNITVGLSKAGDYYVSCLVAENIPDPILQGGILGIDLGIKHLLTLSTGEKIENPQWLQASEKKIKQAQRQLAHCQKGSQGWKKAKKRLAKRSAKVANQRDDFYHKLTHQLAEENQLIRLETLNVKGMRQNHHLAKAISNASWGIFKEFLTYKAKWYGCQLEFIPPFYPSSQLCHVCQYRYRELTLSERIWTCPECGTQHDRDINAALNIRNYGTSGTGETT